jgi:D-amino peptidase
MVAGLDNTYDLVIFAGYHAGAGYSPGCMDHSYYGRVVCELRINGRVMNEATANAGRAVKYRPREDIKQETIAKTSRILDKEKKSIPLYHLDTPCTLSITFHRSVMADMVAHIPGSIRNDAR